MKNIKNILLLLLCIHQIQAQIYPGKYQIKLFYSQKALESTSGYLALNPECENSAAAACKKQVWNISIVPGRPDVFTLQNTDNNLFLSYTLNGTNAITSFAKMNPPRIGSKRDEQYFYIKETSNRVGSGKGYIVRPYNINNSAMAEKFYFAAQENAMNYDNCPLIIDDRTSSDPATMSYSNLLFTFTPAGPTVNVAPSRNEGSTMTTSSMRLTSSSDNKLDIDFKTGSDNLEVKSFQENLEIRIIILNKPDIILTDANKGQSWPNNSFRRVTIPLPANITAEEIKEIHLYRKPKGGITYVWDMGQKDNWNLENMIVTAYIKIDGVKKRFDFEKVEALARGYNLFRFIYEGGNNETEGTKLLRKLTLKSNTSTTSNTPTPNISATTKASIDILFGTGGDDLRGGNNDNVNVVLSFKSSPRKVTISNVFNKRPLPNFTQKSRVMEILNSDSMDINDIKEVEVRHTGGGGMGADNWDVDKIKISISKNGITRLLVDRVGAPIHRYTGDTRSRRFVVE